MKYIKNLPSTDKKISEKLILDGWARLKEPSSITKTILFSFPLMIINGIIAITISFYLHPDIKNILNRNTFSISIKLDLFSLIYIGIFILFMIIHEFIHASFIPNGLKSDKVYWGINGVFAFVYTTEIIKKSRYIIISIMPLILLSIVLPFILKLLGLLNGFTIALCVINAMGSSVDCFNILLILKQVPKDSYIVSNGSETYFKKNNY